MGELTTHVDTVTAEDSDPGRALKLTAHAVARIGDRIPLTRKLNRHLEGEEKRAGLASDLFAVGAELGTRNADVLASQVEGKLSTLGEDLKAQRAKKASKNNHNPQES